MNICCIVMAAGRASRFGENKLLRTFRGKPLYLHALQAIPPAVFSRVAVVTAYEEIAQQAETMGFFVVENPCPEAGISRTVRLGLAQAADCDGALFMTADQPFLSPESLRAMAAAFQERPDALVAAASGEKRGNPCLFPRSLFSALEKLEGDVGGSAVIRSNEDRLLLVQVPEEELADCDTREAFLELERAEIREKTGENL